MRQHRRGLSLTEVLVAMFVMALGLMALLTLFPLGAMQIGQALKDDRTAQTASQADAWVQVWWRDAVAAYKDNPNAFPGDPALLALTDPNVENGRASAQSSNGPPPVFNRFYTAPYLPSTGLSLLPSTPPASLGAANQPFNSAGTSLQVANVIADTAGTLTSAGIATQARFVNVSPGSLTTPGYPVLLDPLGYLATRSGAAAQDRFWVGRNNGTVYGAGGAVPLLIPRRTTAGISSTTQAYATCALTDDMTFQANGGAGNGTEPLARQGRYHWAALIQRPDNSRPNTASLTVLVFDGRPPFLGIQGDEVVLTNEFVNPLGPSALGTVTAGDRSLSLNVPTRGADQPQLVRRGGWVMVASLTGGVRSVGFHRVTGLTTGDEATVSGTAVTQMSLDLDPPVKDELKSATGGPLPIGQVQVYLMAGLSEVFLRAPLLP